MKKLIRNNLKNKVEMIEAEISIASIFKNEDNILVKIQHVGLCRTDLLVANGSIVTPFNQLTLGHEFSAIVSYDPKGLLENNSWIGFNPLYKQSFMGLDFDGALCEEVWIPRVAIIPVNKNTNLTSQMIAYLEPVAASGAPIKKLYKPSKILIIGTNRIAKLTALILNSSGHETTLCSEENLNLIESNSYSYIVETAFTKEVINHISRILENNGTWLLKSRQKIPTQISSMEFVAKEINILGVNYLDFDKSLAWMEENYTNLQELIGKSYAFEDWENAFDEAKKSEMKKIFICVTK